MNTLRAGTLLSFQPILGMRDSSPLELETKNRVIDSVGKLLAENGFEMADYPIVEPTELFVKKSGGDIGGRLYSFVDPGGNRVSLRPEFTSSVIRSFLLEGSPNAGVRRQYAGPVFRYSDGKYTNELKQFTQIGCELIGSDSLQSDAQILSLALQAVSLTDTPSVTVRMGNVGLIRSLLTGHGLNETICFFVLSNLATLRAGAMSSGEIVKRATDLGLVSDLQGQANRNQQLSDKEYIESHMSENLSGNTGRRSRSDIINRLVAKENTKVDSKSLSKAIDQLTLFLQIAEGELSLGSSLDLGTDFGKDVQENINELISIREGVGDFASLEVRYILDFSTNRGLTYYSGLIFDISLDVTGDTVVGGGGRYDGLVRMLGGSEDVPAVGFAINVDSLLSSVTQSSSIGKR